MHTVVDICAVGLVVAAATHVVGLVLLRHEYRGNTRVPFLAVLAPFAGAIVAYASIGSRNTAFTLAAIGALIVAATVWRMPHFRPSGVLIWVSYLALVAFGIPWTVWFVLTMPVSTLTRTLLLCAFPVGVITLPATLVQVQEGWDVVCRSHWKRPRAPLAGLVDGYEPRVSIHVPVHAEPPDIVIATLESISALEYSNFEVLVIDNNTTDESLWRPVRERCLELGPRFRFFHVEGMTGAKAGALNYALERTDRGAELIAVVDADYQVSPEFLARTVGHFLDPSIGFVQGPHAYRDYGSRTFQRWCNWEYTFFFHTTMVALNELDAGLTVGTMSVIRKRALVEAGGWAEWCLTEDSELSIRLHALGYSGVYFTDVLGRGLIPETFGGYKQQRFRWTYGPVQEFKRHLRLVLPGPLGRPSRMSRTQKVHHLNHGLDRMNIGIFAALMPLGVATVISMVLHREVIPVPYALWAAVTAYLINSVAMKWLIYRRVVGASRREALGGIFVFMALTHVILVASVRCTLGRAAQWQRTNKFRAHGRGIGAIGPAVVELAVALIALVSAVGTFVALPRGGVATMFEIGLLMVAMTYGMAPVAALVAERDLKRRASVSVLSARAPRPLVGDVRRSA